MGIYINHMKEFRMPMRILWNVHVFNLLETTVHVVELIYCKEGNLILFCRLICY